MITNSSIIKQASDTPRTERELLWEVSDWLVEEAAVLDEHNFEGWLKLLSRDLEYLVPLRRNVNIRDARDVAFSYGYFDEDYRSVSARVLRVSRTRSAWSEEPPSRTRHFVSNIRIMGHSGGAVDAVSSVLLTRSRGDESDVDVLPYERRDRFVREAGVLKLRKRIALLDQVTQGTPNFGVFL